MTTAIDVVELARALVRCPSVTPEDAGALGVLEEALGSLGFHCRRLAFADEAERVENLYARHGDGPPVFCFAGHTDVVPAGNVAAWTADPFGAEIVDGVLYGRGAVDMKGAIAAFTSATAAFLDDRGCKFRGTIAYLITGDEEGRSINGTRKTLEQLCHEGEKFDACLVGEPTNPNMLGEMVKVGRRGSLSGVLVAHGVQGHTAYPDLAENPIPKMLRLLGALIKEPPDSGTENFPPSNLEITSIDVGNSVTNVIPGTVESTFNVRFNDSYTAESLEHWLRERLDTVGLEYDLFITVTGEAFLTKPGALTDLVTSAVKKVTGKTPELSTTGGTSDARYLKDMVPVIEFGLAGSTMHKVDEHVTITDLKVLSEIYRAILDSYFVE